MTDVLDIPEFPLFRRGKVRDTWDLGDQLLMVATDRISAFDVILPEPIPGKGRVLTSLSAFWFRRTAEIAPNHLLSTDVVDLPPVLQRYADALRGRFMLVKKAQRIDIECVVRGYLSGSAWVEYRDRGTVCEQALPAGLVESAKLPEPIFTPATKADSGHDENISIATMQTLVGREKTERLVDLSLRLYDFGARHAEQHGMIVADTKFEFGEVDGQVIVIDEMLTPDSSRFWDMSSYSPGGPQESFDKQPVRDWLTAQGWNRKPPAPHLPPEIIEQTGWRYREAYRRLTGKDLNSA
ncbi:MAG: phosphoribosylaminoimidazolesuccinocarboxamide synthase [Chloroflexi bacterium]|nr:MAG: phosphoribosylaminoimidazolesuccinocarboxamide synthase [Chloroflexota bacterium]